MPLPRCAKNSSNVGYVVDITDAKGLYYIILDDRTGSPDSPIMRISIPAGMQNEMTKRISNHTLQKITVSIFFVIYLIDVFGDLFN